MAYPSSSSSQPLANPFSIISSHFCAPYPIDLAIIRNVLTISDGNFVVTDINGNIVFKVKGAFLSVHDRRVLLDGAGNPIVTFKQKVVDAMDVISSMFKFQYYTYIMYLYCLFCIDAGNDCT